MISFRSLLAAAPLLALAVAQNIAFTSTPAVVEAGESYNITWGGGDGTGVTLTLRRGNPKDLTTVDTLADNLMESYYVWEAPSSLEDGDDYALQITQGQSDINYSGLFTVEGGESSSSSSSSASASNATATSTASSFATGNSTMSITSMASASGTGTAIARNSTFSTATLSSSSGEATFGDMTSTRSSASRTATDSAASGTSAPSNDAPLRTGSSAALILGIVAAVMLH
ncbi:hypothetical protein PMZ80_007048 [Knufia obscura]|uniref:Yeast cell wall synthesis Kre9/Knh1-like N-terminal domain-containing protein n=2 Tax=Knufia TaxID=430999 RepID=A0AAN8I3R3_9EURO|nr:hypothetical protein PMZ80_007048 [Knufia obscura]KAK5953057.1 hypothetical protein OHC33_005625 [Knufia fluminis]